MWYSFEKHEAVNVVAISIERVKEIIAENKKGKRVEALSNVIIKEEKQLDFENVVGQDSLERFDVKKSRKKKKKKRRNKKRRPNEKQNNSQNS